jgi:hypothetical protein
MAMIYNCTIEQEGDMFIVQFPDMPNIQTYGNTHEEALAVCCASRIRPQKNRLSADFYPTNCVRTRGTPYLWYAQPDNRGFFAAASAKNLQARQAASNGTGSP